MNWNRITDEYTAGLASSAVTLPREVIRMTPFDEINEAHEEYERVRQIESGGLIAFAIGGICGIVGGVVLAILLGARFPV